MRYVWNVEGMLSIHERDKSIDVYELAVVAMSDLTLDALTMTLAKLKEALPGPRAQQLQDFWDLASTERDIVFRRARRTENRWYVSAFLKAAAESTRENISRRRQADTCNAKCLDMASITNDVAEGMFAHQSKALTDGKGGQNRSRGVALTKASQTFEVAHRAKAKRRRRFMKALHRKQVRMQDWVENHRDDTNFLNLFNEQYITENRRHQIIWDALSGRTAARKGNRAKLKVRDDIKLESMVQNNITLQSRHEKRLKEYWKLKSRPRILTYQALCEKFIEHNDETGKEHSYAEKLDIVQKQIQLRKQYDRITKVRIPPPPFLPSSLPAPTPHTIARR